MFYQCSCNVLIGGNLGLHGTILGMLGLTIHRATTISRRATFNNEKRQTACKRVLSHPCGRWMAIRLGRPLPDASRDLPERRCGNPSAAQSRRPFLFGLAPGGVYPATPVTERAVRSYRTLSPLPADLAVCVGGLLSVALSLGSPPPAVTRHRVSVEPGLSSPCGFPHCKRRPSSRLTLISL